MKLSPDKKPLLSLAALALGVLVASASWMILRFGQYAAIFDMDSFEYMDWTLHAYIIMEITMIPVAGKLVDLYGLKRVFFVGAIIFMVASLLCAVSSSFAMLSWFRGAQGVGGGLVIGVGFAAPGLVGKYHHGIPFGQGLASGAFAIGSLYGAIVGYWLISKFNSWTNLFYISVVLMAVAVVLVYRFVDDSPKRERKVDIPGMVLIALIFLSLSAMIQLVNVHFFEDNPWTLMIPAFTAAVCAALYYRNQLADDPVFVRGLTRPLIAQIAVLMVVSVFVIGLLQFYMKAYLLLHDFDIYAGGFAFLFLLLGAVITSEIGARKIASQGVRKFLILGCGLLLIALVLTYLVLKWGQFYFYGIMLFLGAGFGCMVTSIISSLQMNTAPKDRGAIASFAVGARMLAIIAGLAGVSNFVIVKVDEYINAVTGIPMSDTDNILEILAAVLTHLIDTGEDIMDVVLDRYISAFQDWTLVSMVAVAVVGVLVFLFYKGGDEVTFEQSEATEEHSEHKVEMQSEE